MSTFVKTLHDLLTPAVLDETLSSAGDTADKTDVLSTLYALLGVRLTDTAVVNHLATLNSDETLGDNIVKALLGKQDSQIPASTEASLLYNALAAKANLPTDTVAALAGNALPKAYDFIKARAGTTAINHHMAAEQDNLRGVLPVWLTGFFPAGLLASTAMTSPINPLSSPLPANHPQDMHTNPTQTTDHGTPAQASPATASSAPTHEGFKKTLLPLIALLIVGGLAWLMLKGCQKEPSRIAVPAINQNTPSELSPATLALALNSTGDALYSCDGVVGNAGLGEQLRAGIAKVFGADTCTFAQTSGIANDMPAAQYVPQILGFMKGTPNADIHISGKNILLNAPDAVALDGLISTIKGALPSDFTVGANPNPINQTTQPNTANTDATEQAVEAPASDTQPTEPTEPEQTTDAAANTDSNALVQKSLENAKTALSTLKDDNPDELIKALNLQIINFASNSAHIPADNKAILDMAVKHLKDKDIKLTITGHTDNRGEPDGNKLLSEARARAVRDYLVAQGVNPKALKVVGKGDAEPVADNNSEEGRFKNRRIEFSLRK